MAKQESDWRDYLTDEEVPRVAVLESQFEQAKETQRRLADQMNRVRNRCFQRRRYALSKAGTDG